jgi:uncharacterized protein YjbI with pentapeptide repeats
MELTEVFKLHKLWLDGKSARIPADLRGADLSGADLRGADLSIADLSGAYLSGEYLSKIKIGRI